MLSLNETWKRCREMWKGVVDILEIADYEDEEICIHLAKKIWLKQSKYKKDIYNGCFFCDYVISSGEPIVNPDIPGGCYYCPGRKIDPYFACQNPEYHWAYKPREFYRKIVSMDRIRNKRKK